ncbi:aminotransferase class V-fold PLP-dependent enzyme [Faecalibacterium prausnitzii]|uniref:Cysteine desulfurase family protein n=1 Tax=Faecalibacterium prausnitzii M21/2 TaxID=411485 RepID=A8SD03_9FIRM|nr:aminotransferase class V-fold PLP-dependent enzyme [Faecalibacterium prausnitzii]EDP21154.1 cysteine desulfurase family protein [Faecalibacterium prausnitzii M21/2]
MAYFDNAATTYPKPDRVYSFMDAFYRKCGGNVGRGDYGIAKSAGALVADTRTHLQELLHCPAKQVVFTPTATIALNIILQGLCMMGMKNFYISPFEHNAVTRTLHHFENTGEINVTQLAVTSDFRYDLEKIRYQFDDCKPDVVVVSHASNVIGLIAPAAEIFELAKKYGSYTVLDMSQTAGLVDCDVGRTTFDFAVFAGHKTLYGPTGISGFVMKPEIQLPAVLFGGTGYDSANQNMPDSLPERYEMGTSNIAGIAGLNAALQWSQEIGLQKIFEHEQQNRKKLLDILSQYDFITVVGNSPEQQYVGIVSCLFEGISSDVAGNLLSKQGVSVRTGLHCAPLAHKFLGTYPAGTIRFSVGYFTLQEDFDALSEALDAIEDNL